MTQAHRKESIAQPVRVVDVATMSGRWLFVLTWQFDAIRDVVVCICLFLCFCLFVT